MIRDTSQGPIFQVLLRGRQRHTGSHARQPWITRTTFPRAAVCFLMDPRDLDRIYGFQHVLAVIPSRTLCLSQIHPPLSLILEVAGIELSHTFFCICVMLTTDRTTRTCPSPTVLNQRTASTLQAASIIIFTPKLPNEILLDGNFQKSAALVRTPSTGALFKMTPTTRTPNL